MDLKERVGVQTVPFLKIRYNLSGAIRYWSPVLCRDGAGGEVAEEVDGGLGLGQSSAQMR